MAVIGIDINDTALRNRIVTAVCGNYGYKAKIPGSVAGTETDNPQTKPQFANEIVKNFLKENVQAWEVNQAGEAARKTARDKVDVEVTL